MSGFFGNAEHSSVISGPVLRGLLLAGPAAVFVSAVGGHGKPAERGDPESLPETMVQAQLGAMEARSEVSIEEVATDKGYHKAEPLAKLEAWSVRTYVVERE